MKLDDLARLSLTYPEVGATAGELPAGYRHIRASAMIGTGRDRFERAGAAVVRWGMQRGAGLRVQATTEAAAVGTELVVRIGPIPAPCRVVYVLDETDRRGFAYGTLAGHPESGEELFSVRYDPATDAVHAEVVAFSRPATWWSRLGGPVTRLLQRVVTRRYLTGI
ncbi:MULTISPECIES: DUF1990 domain-containing protein [unclassified Mycolicibacterium]|uniref:DUF1990 domain-containing protein n=1 Tax=unclassified Mycolicibacterium TaxID=2636767 RepID=UPI0013098B4C|nr:MULTISPECIES: DUF1990 domain-containing protein [unclassified Mycolicibacterium]MUL80206.1 DUF1990 domain-containing protein [Mycolicibacterium sp. CBMA 329]MUL85973.1 DUF1990 domain-containing protein [Mycolicibacterium sp. CBMA 331]MUM03004.1 DUF1990 domain-containing protein [Mycolicibacterium sp. CBMA 334]MUM26816.1 DUF1990 domain-containing protein [Mycolicibacterium sp. CBMA 295]MUM36269.1 DUF1990 domain-containing protein [Mycolicibacterium sp. CBMA 247]